MDVATELLVLKLLIAPSFVGLVSLIAVRFGHRTAGWLVALPINTGTILFVLTISDGTSFASGAAFGALLGIVSLSVFAIGYAASATRYRWPTCLAVASAGFAVSTLGLSRFPGSVLIDLAMAVGSVALVIRLLPRREESDPAQAPPRWEIPLRMLTAALLVLTITTVADTLGPQLSGLLSPVPVFTITLVIFTHSRRGPDPVFVFLHGLQYGLFSFAAFCAVAGVLLVPFGVAVAIGVGLLAFLGVYALVRAVTDFGTPLPSGRRSD